ncbi:MAG: response regulator [Lachnospiraceae bacterium]|nr:response regulator [Lachnospiraceae bacterium]
MISVADALREIYVSLTALLFNLILLLVIRIQGYRTGTQTSPFRNVALAILLSNALTCIQVFFNHADIGTPVLVRAVLQAAAFMGNTFVCYYFSVYVVDNFSRHKPMPDQIPLFSKLMLLAEAVLLVVYLIVCLPRMLETNTFIPPTGFFYLLVGIVMEFYHLAFCTYYFIRERKILNKRARIIIIIAFLLTISTVLIQGFLGERPMINYLGATIGLFLFYINAETPDYQRLVQTMEDLEAEKRRADLAARSKADFLANMSHEIRTPINAVLGMNEMILRESTDEHILSYAQNVESSGKNLFAIINDILDYSKIEAGKMEILNNTYRLSSLLQDLCAMTKAFAEKKGLTFTLKVDEEIPDALIGDEAHVRQVLWNLLENAVKYTDSGSVSFSVTKENTSLRPGSIVKLFFNVTDTGIGIRKEDIQNLFKEFERADLNRNYTIEGTGLGLVITSNLLSMMNGEIGVKSTYGEGTTFLVTLPQSVNRVNTIGKIADRINKEDGTKNPSQKAFTAPNAKVLVVDDTQLNLTVMKGLMKKTQLQLRMAQSGIEALNMTKDTSFDLILLDFRMPEMDGEETLDRIKNQLEGANKDTPIVCLTADAEAGAKTHYLSLGFTDFLTKPVDGRMLDELLLRLLPADRIEWIS